MMKLFAVAAIVMMAMGRVPVFTKFIDSTADLRSKQLAARYSITDFFAYCYCSLAPRTTGVNHFRCSLEQSRGQEDYE